MQFVLTLTPPMKQLTAKQTI